MRWYVMCIGVLLLLGCRNREKNILIDTIPVAHMQEDIAFLKKLVYSAHAGVFAYNTREQLDFFF